MNNFLICVGSYVKPLFRQAKATVKQIGQVSVDVGDTDCKIPLASAYNRTNRIEGPDRPKKKTIRC